MADENEAVVVAEETTVAENQEQETGSGEERQQETETNTESEQPTEQASGEGDDGKEQPEKPKKQADPFQKRIDTLTKNWREEERQRKELEERLKLYEQGNEKKEEGERPSQADLEKLAEQKASELVSHREYQARVNSWYQGGKTEFPDDFDDKCNIVASLGAAERPEFMQIVTDPDLVPDGHKVVAALADDPQEAARILSLPPIAMSAALVKYADKVGKPKGKSVSKAPDPMKPISGSAKANDEPSPDDSEEEWFRKREAQIAARRKSGARF